MDYQARDVSPDPGMILTLLTTNPSVLMILFWLMIKILSSSATIFLLRS